MTGRKGSRRQVTSPNRKRLFNHGCEHLRDWCRRREEAGRLLTEITSLASAPSSPCTEAVCVDCSLKASTPRDLAEKHRRSPHAICFDRARMQFYCSCCSDYTYVLHRTPLWWPTMFVTPNFVRFLIPNGPEISLESQQLHGGVRSTVVCRGCWLSTVLRTPP